MATNVKALQIESKVMSSDVFWIRQCWSQVTFRIWWSLETQPLCSKMMRGWMKSKWKEWWDSYLDTLPITQRTPAHDGGRRHQWDVISRSPPSGKFADESTSQEAWKVLQRVSNHSFRCANTAGDRRTSYILFIFLPSHVLNRRKLFGEMGRSDTWTSCQLGKVFVR